jgi:hypothetical protein
MRELRAVVVVSISIFFSIAGCSSTPAVALCLNLKTVGATSAAQSSSPGATRPSQDTKAGPRYSGMYSFLKEGEFVQLTIEDGVQLTGFVSRYGDGESDKGAFLDQFFKTGKLEGNNLSFTTEIVHGVWFDFKGTVERGEGKNPGDEGYYVLKGTLIQSSTDVNKKVSSHSQNVLFKMFPQEAGTAPTARN